MPKIFVYFIFVLSVFPTFGHNAIIIGHVENTLVTAVGGRINISTIALNEIEQSVPISEDGEFRLSFDVQGYKELFLTIGEQTTSFYIQPGDSFSINIDYTNFDKGIVFKGRGSSKNIFYKEFKSMFYYGHEQDIYQANARRSAYGFSEYVDSLQSAKLKFLHCHGDLPENFRRFFADVQVYQLASAKLTYGPFWVYLNQKMDTFPEIPSNYYNFLKDLSLGRDSLLQIPEYFDFIKSAFTYYEGEIYRCTKADLTAQDVHELGKILFKNDKIIEAYDAYSAYSRLEHRPFAEGAKSYDFFTQKYPASVYLSEVETLYRKVSRVAPGRTAPVFMLKDLNGKDRMLSEFKGKVIYLDFWASWCAPCLAEMSSSKKIEKKYRGLDIVFLYISVDEDQKSWRNMVLKTDIQGIHLNAPGFSNSVSLSYNITGIPTYFIIGRDGRIVDNNPPRPSTGEKIENAINRALTQ